MIMDTDGDTNGHMENDRSDVSSPVGNDVIFDLHTLL